MDPVKSTPTWKIIMYTLLVTTGYGKDNTIIHIGLVLYLALEDLNKSTMNTIK